MKTSLNPQEAAEIALRYSEQRMAEGLKILGWSCAEDNSVKARMIDLVKTPRRRENIDASYYQKLHEGTPSFQKNNWLLSEFDKLRTTTAKTIVELGCGNGAFLKAIAPYVDHVTGLDWAHSPLLKPLPQNVTFFQRDILNDEIPKCDLLCSADILEHFSPEEIEPLLTKMWNCAPQQYHVISCYDDGHSHLTVMPPGAWLATFRRIDLLSTLIKVNVRRNDPRQVICTITNIFDL